MIKTNIGAKNLATGLPQRRRSAETGNFFGSTVKRRNAHFGINRKHAIGNAVENGLYMNRIIRGLCHVETLRGIKKVL